LKYIGKQQFFYFRGNTLACKLLQKDLDKYSKLVDNPNGLNNYVNDVLEALPKNSTGW